MSRLPIGSRTKARGLAAGVALATLILAAGARGGPNSPTAGQLIGQVARQATAWYQRTPAPDRICWGGLAACALLGLAVTGERLLRLRRGRVMPEAIAGRFLERIHEGTLDQGKGSDLCEMHPSPASRVALAALRRWGRPVADLERAVALARGLEANRLRRNVGTLRRIAALAPLLGLLGSLRAAGRALAVQGQGPAGAGSWGPDLAQALGPLTAGVALAILALVAYDGLVGRVEKLVNDLDRLGAETVDAIALISPPQSQSQSVPDPTRRGPSFKVRTPHQARVEEWKGAAADRLDSLT